MVGHLGGQFKRAINLASDSSGTHREHRPRRRGPANTEVSQPALRRPPHPSQPAPSPPSPATLAAPLPPGTSARPPGSHKSLKLNMSLSHMSLRRSRQAGWPPGRQPTQAEPAAGPPRPQPDAPEEAPGGKTSAAGPVPGPLPLPPRRAVG